MVHRLSGPKGQKSDTIQYNKYVTTDVYAAKQFFFNKNSLIIEIKLKSQRELIYFSVHKHFL